MDGESHEANSKQQIIQSKTSSEHSNANTEMVCIGIIHLLCLH